MCLFLEAFLCLKLGVILMAALKCILSQGKKVWIHCTHTLMQCIKALQFGDDSATDINSTYLDEEDSKTLEYGLVCTPVSLNAMTNAWGELIMSTIWLNQPVWLKSVYFYKIIFDRFHK